MLFANDAVSGGGFAMAVLSCESAMAMAVTDGDAHGGPPQLLPAHRTPVASASMRTDGCASRARAPPRTPCHCLYGLQRSAGHKDLLLGIVN